MNGFFSLLHGPFRLQARRNTALQIPLPLKKANTGLAVQ
jgi:hypothetical protein